MLIVELWCLLGDEGLTISCEYLKFKLEKQMVTDEQALSNSCLIPLVRDINVHWQDH